MMELDAESEDYPVAVTQAVLSLLMPDDGMIEPVGAIEGLCVAIAIIAGNTGLTDSPTERQNLSALCQRNIANALTKFFEGAGGRGGEPSMQ